MESIEQRNARLFLKTCNFGNMQCKEKSVISCANTKWFSFVACVLLIILSVVFLTGGICLVTVAQNTSNNSLTKTATSILVADYLIEGDTVTDDVLVYADRETYWEVVGLLDNGYVGTISIPASFTSAEKTMNVTSIAGEAFLDEADLTGVIIGSNITDIGASCFQGCIGLTGDINIPDSVINIGANAFNGCTGIAGTIVIGINVKNIGISAFSNCTNVTGLTWNAINTAAFSGLGNTAACFYSLGINGSGVQVTIGEGVERIPEYFFYTNINSRPNAIGTLKIPNSVTYIGAFAFYRCAGFTSLELGAGLKTISAYAFCSCTGFAGSLILPNSLTTIGDYSFDSCTQFTGTLTIPNSMISVGRTSFRGCTGFTSLDLGSGIKTIGSDAFERCTELTGVLNIPDSVTTITGFAFYGCNKLTAINLGRGVQTIGNNAFYNCSSVTGILIIPESVNDIGHSVFRGPKFTIFRLFRFISPDSITTLGVSSGDPVLPITLQHIVVPNDSGDVYRAAVGWSHSSAVDKIVEVTQPITWSNTFDVENINANSYDIDKTTILQPLSNRTGWDFVQWRINDANGAVISSIDAYTQFGPITLYAEWKALATLVSFHTGTAPSGGGEISPGSIANRNRYADQNFKLPTQGYIVAKNNWEQIGWTTEQYGKQLQNDESLDVFDYAMGATIEADYAYWGASRVFYPVWIRISSDVTLCPGTLTDDGGDVIIVGDQFILEKFPGVPLNLPFATFTAFGYNQIGWTKDEISGGAIVGRQLHNGYTLAADPQTTDTNETYYPVWQPAEYSVKYLPGKYSYGLFNDALIPDATKYHGAYITITAAQYLNPTGYVQVGWTTTFGGGLHYDTLITHQLNSTYYENISITLFPVWQIGTGVVVLHFIGGPHGEYLSDIATVFAFDYTNPTTLTLPSYVTMNSLGRPLTFEGWYTSPDFNPTTRISDPASYATSAPADRTEDYLIPWTLGDNPVIRIYANWE